PAGGLPLGALDGKEGPRPDYVACLYTSVTYLLSGYPEVTRQDWHDCDGAAQEFRFPLHEESSDRLQRSGWTTNEDRQMSAAGLVWVVTAANRGVIVRGQGETPAEAWHRACEQAKALGMPRWASGWGSPARPAGWPRRNRGRPRPPCASWAKWR